MPEKSAIERYVKDIEWIRGELSGMDGLCNPVMGIRDWDDAVAIRLGGKQLLASIDGPYTKRLVMKSALIHAATDVIVKGGRPLFALDTLAGPKSDVVEMVASLKRQAYALALPILGGNTKMEDVEPSCTIAVAGEMMIRRPIRDSGARHGDVIALLGEPIWGTQDERLAKAKVLFETWRAVLESGARITSSKDVTKGGLTAVIYEMSVKSKKDFKLNDRLPCHLTRNLDNFIFTTPKKEFVKIAGVCRNKCCRLENIGAVL
ncbi:MAG: AIR synthase related protein [Candidatus Altiarchaeota archaeon]|nr:AIR synthase related protein [Candidatus Altiarchaeota archaeon]